MTIYKDSKRIVGTNADRIGVPAVSGGWVEVGRTTLSSAGDAVNVTSLPDKRYYMVLANIINSGNAQNKYRLNDDSGSNYANRYSTNGGSDATFTNEAFFSSNPHQGSFKFSQLYVSNLASKEKLIHHHSASSSGSAASAAPERIEGVAKWANTSDAVDEFNMFNGASGDYASGTEVVVLGWDPSDTHTTNFWEELASVELGSAGTNLSSGTISAKKYLWIQTFTKSSSGSIALNMTFNNDTGSNYAQRRSIDGSSDSTNTSRANIQLQADTAADVKINNIFIINNSSTEKLVIHHSAESQASGAGTAPVRRETVGKWANTSSQITEIDIDNGLSGNYDTGSIIKVWGSD